MACPSGSLDYWRKFFRSSNSDIFEIIEQAVLVAATDWPQEFRNRRDQIVESFYTSLLPRCFGCNRLEHQAGEGGGGRSDSGAGVTAVEGEEGDGSVRRDAEKAGKAGSCCNEGPEDLNLFVSNYSYDEAEALTEKIEEENLIFGEVLRIKELLLNHHDESDSVLFESLRRLQLMELTVEVLQATEIGRAVNGLRKHNMKEVRYLVRTLIDGWKVLVDEWVNATAAIADHSPDSVNPSTPTEEEEGLPSPPFDEGALFATQTADIQFSEFFSEMDDDGNFRNNAVHDNIRENGSRPPIHCGPARKSQPLQQPLAPEEKVRMKRQEMQRSIIIPEEMEPMKRQQPRPLTTIEVNRQMTKHELVVKQAKQQEPTMGQARLQGIVNKQNKPVISGSGPGRPIKLVSEQKSGSEVKLKQPQNIAAVQRKQPMAPEDKSKNSEEASIRAKLELAKRKLHEGYQQAENAKKQRTIQVMELHDIPKQAHHNRHPVMKSRNNLRNWANGRH